MWNIESSLLAIFAGIVSGTIVGLVIKFKTKTEQEKTFEVNRKAMLSSLLTSATLGFSRIEKIWKILESLPNFNRSKNYFSDELSDEDFGKILDYIQFTNKLLENILPFSKCSTFISHQEYFEIKGYLQSSLFVGITDGTRVNKKNLIHYEYKKRLDNAFFAKKLLEKYEELLYQNFVLDWAHILYYERLFSLNGLQKLEPGDRVPDYEFSHESVFGNHFF